MKAVCSQKKEIFLGTVKDFNDFLYFLTVMFSLSTKKIVCLGVCSDFTEVALASEDNPAQKVPWQ